MTIRTSQGIAANTDLDEEIPQPWLFFAGTVLGLAGAMRILDAIWAFGYGGALPDELQDGILGSNLTTYAWTWLVIGIILIVSSILVLSRSQLARWVGIIAAILGALSAMTWMPYYPIWSLVYIAGAVLVLYALVVHGGRQSP
jgi:hypothetical protein